MVADDDVRLLPVDGDLLLHPPLHPEEGRPGAAEARGEERVAPELPEVEQAVGHAQHRVHEDEEVQEEGPDVVARRPGGAAGQDQEQDAGGRPVQPLVHPVHDAWRLLLLSVF